ncbi:zinc finger protein 652-A-like isoform X2 [Condylostylus longicornis]|uniref:zinc finger protein 652-A-like isoform X2 n=1 Tax=Condylostylus longicornis TaxID=2530218 RepID=UPI00244DC36E|nr:zinc finger protein 652-A-like isoform X2 [Condylostylus longicornis]
MEDVKKLCRICLKNICESFECKSVFDKDENNVKIAKKIYDISGIFIEKTSYLPEQICIKCDKVLNLAYLFRLNCLESDIKLKESKFTTDIVQVHLIKTETNLDQLLDEVDNLENSEDNKDLFEYQEFLSTNDDSTDQPDNGEHKQEAEDVLSDMSQPLRKKKRHIEWKEGKNPSPRRLCKFNKAWFKEYNWIREGEDQYYATCTVCKCQFSISHGGRSDIARHVNTEKHKQNIDPLLVKQKVFRGNGIKVPQNVNEITYTICEICGNKYPSKTHLRRHLKYHSDVLEYECEICKKKFRLSMQLRKHMRVHTALTLMKDLIPVILVVRHSHHQEFAKNTSGHILAKNHITVKFVTKVLLRKPS